MSEMDTLIAQAEIGERAREFMESELGRYMLGIAEQHVQLAREKLGEVDPDDTKAIRELQNQIWCAQHFKDWIEQAVDIGDSALMAIQQEVS